MKKYIILLSVLVTLFSGCAKIIIPEISPHLYDEQLVDLTEKNLAATLMENNSQLIFTTLDGKIFRWDPKNQIVNSLVHLNSDIDPNIFSQDNYLILKQLKTGKYSIYDLNQLKEIAVLENMEIQQILGMDHEIVVYRANPKELMIFNYRSQKLLKNLKIIGKQRVYNAEFRGDSVFILSRGFLHIYHKSRDTVESKKLNLKASSPFLLDGEMMYYGSNERELVKLSIKSARPSWRFKIAEVLTVKPLKIGNYIVIIPGDNNIYFFTKNGTLHWWEKLNSTLLLPPVLMKENVVVCLWDKNIKFFNYKKKQVTTFPLEQRVKSNPVCIDEYIYVVSEEKLEEEEEDVESTPLYLSKIGNFFGIEITTNPPHVKPLDKSVRFDLKNFNLVEPQYKIKILKNQPGDQTPVFDKILRPDDKPSFIWIPQEPIEYRLLIEIEAKNKKGLTFEQTFTPLDVQKMLRNHYYRVQTQSETNSFN